MLEPAFHLPQSSVILGIGFDREWEFVVCLPTFNHENYIEDAIVSVLAQDLGEIAHVFIFDDASTDQTPQIVSHFAGQHPNRITDGSRKDLVDEASMVRVRNLLSIA